MNFFKRLFGKKTPLKNQIKQSHEEPQIAWIPPEKNPWGVKILDIRPFSQTIISTSENPKMASNAVSYNGEDGSSFMHQMPRNKTSFETTISFPIDGKIEPGVLFFPNVMEQKWAIYFRDNKLIFVRSWIREVLAVAETKQLGNQLIITKIIGELIENEPPKMQKAILKFLIISHVMGEIVPAPLFSDFQTNIDLAAQMAFSQYGKMAHFVYFGDDFDYRPKSILRSHSLFHIAVARGDKQKIDELFTNGNNIHGWAGDGLTPLHWAMAADPEILAYLLEKGGNPDIESLEGATPLMNAVQGNKMEHFQILIDHGADIDYKDHRGFTSLHRAVEMGRVEMVEILVAKGVDIHAEAQGYSALTFAQKTNQTEIISLLTQK